MPTLTLLLGVLVWLVLPILVFARQRAAPYGSAGLTTAYLVQIGIVYWPGALASALPWSWYGELELVSLGFGPSVLGALAFALGAAIVAPALIRARERSVAPQPALAALSPPVSLAVVYILIGLLSLIVITPLILGRPTVGALAVAANNFLLAGIMLGTWRSLRQNGRGLALWLLMAGSLPIFSVMLFGFLGLGFVALVVILTFVLSQTRLRRRALLGLLLSVYLGMSGFVTYMRDRSAIRQLTGAEAGLPARVAQLTDTVERFEWFDPQNQRHLRELNDRLNQSYLVGAAVVMIRDGYSEYAGGRTISDAFLALIPRALWPEKPLVAGGSELVSAFTGMTFADGTSVGMGQVLEFYVNFGLIGVVAGFILYGTLLGLIDAFAIRRLRAGDQAGFAFWVMGGLAMLSSTNALFEITSSVGAALLIAWLVNGAIRVLVGRQVGDGKR